MIGKKVDFKVPGGFNTGEIFDKYQGYKWVEEASHTGKIKTCISIDYYLIKVFEGAGNQYGYYHVPCNEIINMLDHIPGLQHLPR
jgi:hypothetical protein